MSARVVADEVKTLRSPLIDRFGLDMRVRKMKRDASLVAFVESAHVLLVGTTVPLSEYVAGLERHEAESPCETCRGFGCACDF